MQTVLLLADAMNVVVHHVFDLGWEVQWDAITAYTRPNPVLDEGPGPIMVRE